MILFYHFELWSLTGRSQHDKILIAPNETKGEIVDPRADLPFLSTRLIMTIKGFIIGSNESALDITLVSGEDDNIPVPIVYNFNISHNRGKILAETMLAAIERWKNEI